MLIIWFSLCFLLNCCLCQYNVYQIPDSKVGFGASPTWDSKTQSLYHGDFLGTDTNIVRYDYREKRIYRARVPFTLLPLTAVVFIIPVKEGKNLFAIGVSSRVVKLIRWDGISPEVEYIQDLFAVEQDPYYSTNFWHISKADPKGRFFGSTFRMEFCSTNPIANASFYRWTPKQGIKKLMGQIKVAGGFDFDRKKRIFYEADACTNKIRAYDYFPKTGKICNGRDVFDFNNSTMPGYSCVGVALDCKGKIWSNLYRTGEVWKIDPKTSRKLDSFRLPVPTIVNCVFGGDRLDVMFCTTTSTPIDIYTGASDNSTLPDAAGSLFMITGFKHGGYGGNRLSLAV